MSGLAAYCRASRATWLEELRREGEALRKAAEESQRLSNKVNACFTCGLADGSTRVHAPEGTWCVLCWNQRRKRKPCWQPPRLTDER